MHWSEIGHSVEGRPIEAVKIGSGPNAVVFVGGLHMGFAPATSNLADDLIDYFYENPGTIPSSVTVYVVPLANPDSSYNPGELEGRLNANGVDLNRNWDCRWKKDATWRGLTIPGSGGDGPFSEPESRLLADFITSKNPVAVVFWEAKARGGLVSPGNCGSRTRKSEELATTYGRAAGYQVSDFEQLTNQVLNGDSTNWLDKMGIPAIAVLLPEYQSTDWSANLRGILAVLSSSR